jgi:hypothetical protein
MNERKPSDELGGLMEARRRKTGTRHPQTFLSMRARLNHFAMTVSAGGLSFSMGSIR